MEKDILLLVGESASGKDYLSKQLVENYGFNNMVSYTTRPMRDGETEGVEYHFIKSNEEFRQLMLDGEIFEVAEYHTKHGLWLYGYGRKSIPERGKFKNVAIVNPCGIEQFLQSEIKDRLCVLDIHTPNHMRLEKVCERYGGIDKMTDIQLAEAFRREVEDAKPFHEYFNAESDNVNWRHLFKDVPNEEWEHEYSGSIGLAIRRIRSIMDMEVNKCV